jgi:hypothetical protein
VGQRPGMSPEPWPECSWQIGWFRPLTLKEHPAAAVVEVNEVSQSVPGVAIVFSFPGLTDDAESLSMAKLAAVYECRSGAVGNWNDRRVVGHK